MTPDASPRETPDATPDATTDATPDGSSAVSVAAASSEVADAEADTMPAATAELADADLMGVAGPIEFVPVEFVGVTVTLPSAYPTLMFEEAGSPRRRIAIPIGMAEGVAIAHAARDIATPRPLTHELFVTALTAYRISVEVLRITAVHNNSFSAELVLSGPGGQRTLDCRVSDGVALCLRQRPRVPITVAPGVMDQVGGVNASTT